MNGVLLGFVIFFVALFLILIVIGIFFWFSSSDSETTICTTEQLNTPEENWAAYQAVPTGTNPFYLKIALPWVKLALSAGTPIFPFRNIVKSIPNGWVKNTFRMQDKLIRK
jgi:hypothetical protein